MSKSESNPIPWIVLSLILIVANFGCATKKYVRQQVAPAHQQVAKLEKQTNDKIAYAYHKQERDTSQLNQRVDATDQRVDEAQGTASRALETAQSNSADISTLQSGGPNYHLLRQADVLFGFDRSTLTPQAKRTLDEIASKARRTPHSVVEISGFTDSIGSRSYNYALSRQRAEAVQRYLVQQNIPPRAIHIVGMGKETPLMAGERGQRNAMARRAEVRVFGVAGLSRGTAARAQ